MYDETPEKNVTAYTVELDRGYVVVSAYADAASLIPEWSDCDTPLYLSMDSYDTDSILYLGTYGYYLDVGDKKVEDISGNLVEKTELVNDVELNRNVANIPASVVDDLNESMETEGKASTSSVITNPFTHANANYAGPFKCHDYVNKWENYVLFYRTSDFNTVNNVSYNNHCGPTAITNLMCMYQYKYRGIKNESDAAKTMFNYVAQYGIRNLYYNNSDSKYFGGTSDTGAGPYIRGAFSSYLGVSTTTLLYEVKYNNFRNSFANDAVMYLILHKHETYENHHLVGYAYTRLQSTTTGWYKTYLKVCDGWGKNGRYIDLASVSDDSAYYEVNFG